MTIDRAGASGASSSSSLLDGDGNIPFELLPEAIKSQRVFNEDLSNQTNGINKVFITEFDFISGTLKVMADGRVLDLDSDYTITDNNEFMLDAGFTVEDLVSITVDYSKPIVLAGNNVYNEDLSNQADGVNRVFATEFDFIADTLKVITDSVELNYNDDYTVTGDNEFTLSENYTIKDLVSITVDYTKN